MTADIGPPPVIGPDHQLPAHVPARSWPLRVLLLMLVVAALAVAAALIARSRSKARGAAPPPTAVTVTTATAKTGDIAVRLESIGTVTPVHTASVTSQVSGMVVAVFFQEGQRVEKGDALIDIDARPYRATLLQAQGALERDEHLLAQAKMDLERYRAAWARNAIAKQTLDDQEKLVLQYGGTVKNDRGAVKYNEVQVEFCHIKAPLAGRVGLRLVDPGNVVQANGTAVLAVVTQVEPMTVVFTISEDNLTAVRDRLRQGARLPVDALDRAAQRRLASGELLTIDNVIDTTTGTVKARAIFDNKDDALFPNQFVNVRLVVDTHTGVTLIPSSAIQQNGPQSFVYVIRDGVARVQTVKPTVTDQGLTQVDGVSAGDVVAASGFDRLRDGARVVVSSAPPAPSSSGGAGP